MKKCQALAQLEKEEIETCSVAQAKPFTQSEAERKLVKEMNRTFAPFLSLVLFTQVYIYKVIADILSETNR